MMKKLFIVFLSAFTLENAWAQTNEKIIVHLKNGEQISYAMDNVDFVEIIADETNSGTPVANIGGTIGQAVDLGLSVLWADHNMGATYPADCGKPLEWNSEDISLWGEGWRLPTEQEWQELYDNCKWEWTIRDGIGGRSIVSSDGNSIFIPAAGININNSHLANGSIGIYWTASNDTEDNNGSVKAIGTYFDSANIYRIEYPTANKFTIRLVKDKL